MRYGEGYFSRVLSVYCCVSAKGMWVQILFEKRLSRSFTKDFVWSGMSALPWFSKVMISFRCSKAINIEIRSVISIFGNSWPPQGSSDPLLAPSHLGNLTSFGECSTPGNMTSRVFFTLPCAKNLRRTTRRPTDGIRTHRHQNLYPPMVSATTSHHGLSLTRF